MSSNTITVPADTATLAVPSSANTADTTVDALRKIAERAYYKAEKRGFEPGYEISDWLEAEAELATE